LNERQCASPIALLHCLTPALRASSLFLSWELEAGNLSAAADRLRSFSSQDLYLKLYYAGRLARALIDADKANEAFAILAELRADPTSDQAMIAQMYWRLGAVDDARALMREVAKAALDEAERSPKEPLPVAMAGTQVAIGDRDGAIATLRRIQRFDADRLGVVRASLAGRLAFVRLDADAFALQDGMAGDRAVLANIVVGQARRGDFDAAFTTLDQLRRLPATTREDNYERPGPKTAIASIVRNAARAGDADAFRRAEAVRRELDPPGAGRVTDFLGRRFLEDDIELEGLRDLALARQARLALEYALATQDLDRKVQSLCRVAEGLAGLPNPSYDPLAFFDRW
jgi:tetratricopeptide (TPR) repeat protein